MPFRENGRLGYSIVADGGMTVELAENILHIKGLSWDGINGLGITDILRESIGLGLAAQKWQSIFFKNGAAPQTVIELPGTLRNKEAVERFRAMWGKRHKGIENAQRIRNQAGGVDDRHPIELLGRPHKNQLCLA